MASPRPDTPPTSRRGRRRDIRRRRSRVGTLLTESGPDRAALRALAISSRSQAVPFGVTSTGDGDRDEAQRGLLADMWAGFLVDAPEGVRTET